MVGGNDVTETVAKKVALLLSFAWLITACLNAVLSPSATSTSGPVLTLAPTPTPTVEPTPTPEPTPSLVTGFATWHATGRDGPYAAAGPALRIGDWRDRVVTVTYRYLELISGIEVRVTRQISVTLNDFCACADRNGVPTLLDLSDEAFGTLAFLSVGVIDVEVSW